MIQTLEQPEVVGAAIEHYKVAMMELHLAAAEMLDNTGGECGRDFTATEESVFNALIKQRDELALVFPSIALDIRYQVQDERRSQAKAEQAAANDPLAKLLENFPPERYECGTIKADSLGDMKEKLSQHCENELASVVKETAGNRRYGVYVSIMLDKQ